MSSLLFWTETTAGEARVQFPSRLESVHSAPVVGGVVIAIDWLVPFMTDAQPGSAMLNAATAAMADNLMTGSLIGVKEVLPESTVQC
jgi:hypothetical protein